MATTTIQNKQSNEMMKQATPYDFYDLMMDLSYVDCKKMMSNINEKLGYELLSVHEMARYELKLANTTEKHELLAERIAIQKAKEEEAEYVVKVAREMQKGYMSLMSNQ